ncbi:GGDEF domain-containing protein [Halothermothrix orenii]|uniref:Diguanylate cyclase n=1 Tax=Halothermothrix orenii (strain H 168 / OCM 544 / DSM 9562) TaxID=373903 RepID=B8CY67_HALOH|nr:GGDEF domain-containing protein [Halothermothrix orenii]ACL70236.1 diguanylate cyclase [Halothermothrix orenii H 168]
MRLSKKIKINEKLMVLVGLFYLAFTGSLFYLPFTPGLFLFLFVPVVYLDIVIGLKAALVYNTIFNLLFIVYEGVEYNFAFPGKVAVFLILGCAFTYFILYLISHFCEKYKSKQRDLKESMAQLAASYRTLESTQTKLFALARITKELLAIHDHKELIPVLINLLNSHFFYYNIAYVSKNKNSEINFTMESRIGFTGIDNRHLINIVNEYTPFDDVLIKTVDRDEIIKTTDRVCADTSKRGKLILVPVVTNDDIKGIFLIYNEGDWVEEEDRDILRVLADQTGLLLNKLELIEEINYLAITDEGTDLYNQRYFYKRLNRLFSYAKKNNKPLSVVIFDIDNFKSLNDSYGHLFGDKVLREVASLLQDNIRKNDILARYGGEEFALILPKTGASIAYNIAERIRCIVNKHIFETGGGHKIKISISGGIATYPECKVSKAIELIDLADKALYKSKDDGKNMINSVR